MANDINYQEMDNDDEKPPKGFAREIFEWIESLCTMGLLMLLVLIFVFRVATVDGNSMLPTLDPEDRLIFTDLFYTPKQGDIVVIDSEGLGKFIVKRVIATAGQKIEIDLSGVVKVDGNPIDEKAYIEGGTVSGTYPLASGMSYPATVPEGSVFVLGDNRMNSADSRTASVGFVPTEKIYGKVVLRLFPPQKMKIF
jgi:signal peptidase I